MASPWQVNAAPFLSIKCTLHPAVDVRKSEKGGCVYVRETERERKRGEAPLHVCVCVCVCVCVQSYPRSDCELEDTTVSGVSMEEAGEEWRCVSVCVRVCVCVCECVCGCGADVNKHSPRCRGAAGSTAPPVRRSCFRQSATAAPCPPRWSAAPCPSSAPAAGCRGTPWRTRPRGRTQTCRRISRRPPVMEARQDEVERGGESKRVRHFGGDDFLRREAQSCVSPWRLKHTNYNHQIYLHKHLQGEHVRLQ